MADFNIYGVEDAPEASRPVLEGVKKRYGFVPNLLGGMAESNIALTSYMELNKKLAESTLTPAEQQVLFLAVSYENKCAYCMAAHTAGGKRAELPDDVIEALRAGSSLNDSKLNSLANFARNMLNKRGWVDQEDIDDFLGAGYTKANIFDVIAAIAAKTISNYTNHIVGTPFDDSISKFKWDES
ncbi:MAG: carboxymuconolactone decarboxylase family protein [Candidatus Dadabacteria bacterium]|nr:carboxymuconolactone decarboxylase family protein [Candidatus Dadabacteria bacterium]NIS09038.1 carboxymuconolactone decarboxylase family protein [Candidatus Dadabacteria bacterium]NIX15632.1 carboxymuconolactone decarboxylase family protein [Candidatus Dadabacteria bacterium]NIY22374.1 carboxymuconolactone decarboxylase family protein [Candidatus Dadabacteria bacterium]